MVVDVVCEIVRVVLFVYRGTCVYARGITCMLRRDVRHVFLALPRSMEVELELNSTILPDRGEMCFHACVSRLSSTFRDWQALEKKYKEEDNACPDTASEWQRWFEKTLTI